MSKERRTTEELLFELEQVKRADEDHFQSLLDDMGAPSPLVSVPQPAMWSLTVPGRSGRPCILRHMPTVRQPACIDGLHFPQLIPESAHILLV